MALTLSTPTPGQIPAVLAAMRPWQHHDLPLQLHPGDIGWHGGRGAERTAADLRVWSRGGRALAIGLLDGPDLLRLAVDPQHAEHQDVAHGIAADLCDPMRGVLPAGEARLEARSAPRLRTVLEARDWREDAPWVTLHRDLTRPVEEPALEVEVVNPADPSAFTAVHRSAFASEACTDERWRTLSAQPAAEGSVALLGRDGSGTPVAIVMAWSAGPDRPGLIEPMGVHVDHRSRGHGRAICLAAAARLRAAGASSIAVGTPRSRPGAVATYLAAGFHAEPDSRDLRRDASLR